MPVPPEPHVATEHEKSFHYIVGGVAVLCVVCFLIDQVCETRRTCLVTFQLSGLYVLCSYQGLQFYYKKQRDAAEAKED